MRRGRIVYRRWFRPPPPREVVYREAPPEPLYREPVYDEAYYAPPAVFDDWPAYYGGPVWYEGGHPGGGWGWRHGWGHWR